MLVLPLRRFLVAGLSAPIALAVMTSAPTASAQVDVPSDSDGPPPAVAPSAPEEASPPRTAPARRSKSYWYGWQTAAADGASLGVIGLGASTGASVVTWAGVGGLVFGAPAVHVANGRGGMAALSLTLRVVLPLLGAGIGYAAAGSCHEDPSSHDLFGNCFLHGVGEAAAGAVIGLGSAMILDVSALSYGHREIAEPRETGNLRLTSVAPSYDPLTRTASVGMGGRF